jgi:hypothetical protein
MIRKGILLPDSHPVGIGINQARRGIADLGTEQFPVIYKSVPEPELAAELFCALLAREAALPAPEPILLFDPQNGGYLFGSIDMEYPNSLRAFKLNPDAPDAAAAQVLIEAVLAWKRIREVAVFDEWIHNRDRNLGNLLFAGAGEFVVIDHGKAMDIDMTYPSGNHLCAMLESVCTDDKSRRTLLKSLQRTAAAFDIWHAETPRADLESTGVPAHTTSAETFYNFVEDRLSSLSTHLQNRMPGQQGLIIPSSQS